MTVVFRTADKSHVPHDLVDPTSGAISETRRVLWVNHHAVGPNEAGGTRHYEIGRQLLAHGWHVTIAASDYHYQARTYTRRAGASDRKIIVETTDGVRFHWLWSAPYAANNWRRAWNWLSFAQSLLRAPESEPYDIVIGSSPHLFAAAAAGRLARRWKVPFVLEVRDLWPESLVAAGGRRGPAYVALASLARRLYRDADRIVCLARGTMHQLEAYGVPAAKLVYVPNGTDINAFGNVPRNPRDTVTFVYAGAHGPANGLDVVLDAAALLRNRPDIRIVLVGDGPLKPELMRRAGEQRLANVEFRDPVPKSQIGALFAGSDAGLMILRDTPLFSFAVSPNKLFDYFGAALPVVCNVPGEVAGMIESARGGEQAADASPSALAAAMVRLADRTPEARAALGRCGREWVAREHSREALAQRLDAVLRDVVAR